ncbi:MAG: hypothetical protein WBP81_11750 [Solirubrobacteraceae bacterium]
MVHGESEIDVYESNIARAHPCQRTRTHIKARAAEGFNKMYGIVHPGEQWESNRGRDGRSHCVHGVRCHRAGSARGGTARSDAADGRGGRTRRVHADPDAERRLQGRPDDHAAR